MLPDPYLRAADQRGGAYSILTGIAANNSIASGAVVRIDDLAHNIGLPEYPSMPGPDEPIALAEAPGGRRLSAKQLRASRRRGDRIIAVHRRPAQPAGPSFSQEAVHVEY